jgi:hypothetical protein
MAVRNIAITDTLEQFRTSFNDMCLNDFGDIGTLDSSMSATSVIGAVNELAGQIFSAAGWKMEDSSSTTQTVGAGQTATFKGVSNQTTAVVSVPDILTIGLTNVVNITTSLSAPIVSAGSLTLTNGSITDSSGIVNFGDEHITTTGNIQANNITAPTITTTGGTSVLGTISIVGNTISSTDSTVIHFDDDVQVEGTLRTNTISSRTGDSVSFGNNNLITNGNIYLTGTHSNLGIYFEGATNDAFKTYIRPTDPTAERIVTLPDLTGIAILDTSTGYGTGSIFTASSTLIIYNSAGVAQKTIVGSAT